MRVDLKDYDDRLVGLAERLPQLVWFMRPDGYHEYFNRHWYNLTGMTPDQCRGTGWQSAVHPDDLDAVRSSWRRALETGEPYEAQYRLRRADGGYCWMLSRAMPDRDGSGTILRWYGTSTNIDAQKQAEAALTHLEEQHRLALEAASLGTWSLDLQTRTVSVDTTTCALMNMPPDRSQGLPLGEALAFVHPDDRNSVENAIEAALDPQTGGRLELEYRIAHPDGSLRWIRSSGKLFRAEEGAFGRAAMFLGVVSDNTRQHTFEEGQQLLARELNHRVKNLFAIANGMVSMTARTAKDPKEMAFALRGRLGALSRAHELVQPISDAGHGPGAEVALDRLVEAVLEPYRDGKRITVEGPGVRIGSNTTTSLALVLHELATNAAKYGCLSRGEGRLSIRWFLQDNVVKLDWTETDGPPIEAPPSFEGFGSQLAQRSIAGQLGGALDREWRREGLCVHMTLPLDRLAG